MERPGREKSVGRSSGSWAGLVSGISNNRLTGVVLIVFPEDPGKLECLAAADREPEPHLLLAHPLPLRRELVTVGARLPQELLVAPLPWLRGTRGGFGGRDRRRDYGGRDRLGGTRRGGRSGTRAGGPRPRPGAPPRTCRGRDGRRDCGGRARLGGTRRGGRSGTGAAALRPLPGHRLGTGRGRYRRVRGAPLEDRHGQQDGAGRSSSG